MTITATIARTSILLAAASSLFALTVPAVAAPLDDPLPQASVNVAHTDFTSPKSVRQLKARVRRTAKEICVTNDSPMPMLADERACFDTAMHGALAQIDSKQQQAMRKTTVNVASAQIDSHPAN
jgi:UrcA family protein